MMSVSPLARKFLLSLGKVILEQPYKPETATNKECLRWAISWCQENKATLQKLATMALLAERVFASDQQLAMSSFKETAEADKQLMDFLSLPFEKSRASVFFKHMLTNNGMQSPRNFQAMCAILREAAEL